MNYQKEGIAGNSSFCCNRGAGSKLDYTSQRILSIKD